MQLFLLNDISYNVIIVKSKNVITRYEGYSSGVLYVWNM